jgi:hypothetical protein
MTRLTLVALLGLAITTPAQACMSYPPTAPDAVAMKKTKKEKQPAVKDETPTNVMPPTAVPPRG